MALSKRNGLILIIATTVTVVGVATFYGTNGNFRFLRTTADNSFTISLNTTNSPTLTGGEGTMIDNKGVTWEYHNANDYNQGHVALNHQGYFGVSSNSAYGVTGIGELTVTFEAGSLGELWLLNSVDGSNWGEVEMLKTPEETSKTSVTTTSIANWRYIRLYYHSDSDDSININSLAASYSCVGVDRFEDVDSAKVDNVIASGVSSNMTYAAEYSELSPNSIGGEAVRFSKTDSKASNLALGFGQVYTIGQIQNAKVEFDMQTTNFNYGKSIALIKDTATVGSTIMSAQASSYQWSNIEGDWYHIEVAVDAFISAISGYNGSDKPQNDVLKKQINGIKINAGSCIIDNLKITATETELGNYNNTTQYPPKANTVSWLKISFVGKLYPEQVQITFDDPEHAERIPLDDPKLTNGSPFYVRWLTTGDITVYVTVVSGYNRQAHTLTKTFTVTS